MAGGGYCGMRKNHLMIQHGYYILVPPSKQRAYVIAGDQTSLSTATMSKPPTQCANSSTLNREYIEMLYTSCGCHFFVSKP